MATFTDPAADAATVNQELRGLAHATQRIDDPGAIYPVLGSLTQAVGALAQVLHQLAAFHDTTAGQDCLIGGDPRAGRASSYQASWELHRAGEIMRQVASALDHAHEVEGSISYSRPTAGALPARSLHIEHGPRL